MIVGLIRFLGNVRHCWYGWDVLPVSIRAADHSHPEKPVGPVLGIDPEFQNDLGGAGNNWSSAIRLRYVFSISCRVATIFLVLRVLTKITWATILMTRSQVPDTGRERKTSVVTRLEQIIFFKKSY